MRRIVFSIISGILIIVYCIYSFFVNSKQEDS